LGASATRRIVSKDCLQVRRKDILAASVCAIGIGAGVRAKDGNALEILDLERQGRLGVLQEDGAGGSDLADELEVVGLDAMEGVRVRKEV
jgi:hypothetical protein